MADRRETFERVLAPEPGRTALVVVGRHGAAAPERDFARGDRYDDGHLRAGDGDCRPRTSNTRMTVVEDGGAYGRVVTAKEVVDQISGW